MRRLLKLGNVVRLEIPQSEVHIWMINLDLDDKQVDYQYRVLSVTEKRRAARFHFERHRRRYIVSQGVMRHILSTYLDAEPSDLVYEFGDHGKPALGCVFKTSGLQFNLTHSHEIALFGIVKGVEIGVDVEFFKEMGDINGITTRFFSPTEQAAFFSLPKDKRLQGFYNCWTRKEAFIKAIGEGLSYPLHKFDVSLAPGEPARLIRIETNPEEASRWTLNAFHPTPEYTAAVALRAKKVHFKRFWYGREDIGTRE